MGNIVVLPAARRTRIGLLVAAHAAVLAALSVSIVHGRLRFPGYRIDLDVYRTGVNVVLHGGALYGSLPPMADGEHLPFTYPPFAALVLTPLAVVPYWAASLLMTVSTLALVALVLHTVLRSLDVRPSPMVFGVLLLAAEAAEPILLTVYDGQIDVALMALVVLDILTPNPRWSRGVLVGIAAAVKLTPAVFVLYFLLRRDRRAALNAGLAFLVATGFAYLVDGSDSVRYWTSTVFDPGRIGVESYASNQSLLGALTRLGATGTERTGLWLGLAACVAVLTVRGMRRAFADHGPTVALGLNAVCGLLISPISWSHHWVWIVVIVPAWAVPGLRSGHRLPLAVAGAGALVFLAAPQMWWPHGGGAEDHWNLAEQVTGNGFVLFGIALLVVAARQWAAGPTAATEG